MMRIITAFLFLLFLIPGVSGAITIDPGKFYTLSPAGLSAELWSIDPVDGTTALVSPLTLPGGATPDFRTNSLAFNPDNDLFGWDTANKQLFNIDYSTGQINYIGSPDAKAPRWINGLAFDNTGTLYGLAGTDNLYTINTSTSAVSTVGRTYVDVKHNGLSVNFDTGELYAVTGWGEGKPDYLLSINKEETPVLNDDHSANTSGNYTWSRNPKYPSGTGYSWSPAGHIHLDGVYNGPACCWIPAKIAAERTMDIPTSGYAKIDFDITRNGDGQSRVFFFIKQDNNNWYKFVLTDDTYGSSGWTQGIEKKVNGVSQSWIGPGTVINPGEYTMEVEWTPTRLRMYLNGVPIFNVQTNDTTMLDPNSFLFQLYRFEADWKSVEIQPGHAQIIGDLGVDYYGVGTEFNPFTGELFTIRDSNLLMSIDTNTGEATEIGRLTGIRTVNLAAPYPADSAPIPEPGTIVLMGTGLAGIFSYFRKKKVIV